MKTLKRLAITQTSSNSWQYSNGYDVVAVKKDVDRSSDLHDGRSVYRVNWGSTEQTVQADENELYRLIETKIMTPRSQRYTELEYERAIQKQGYIRGIVQLSIGYMDGSLSFEEMLIRALIDTTEHGKKVKSYEIIGCEDHTIIVMVEVECFTYL